MKHSPTVDAAFAAQGARARKVDDILIIDDHPLMCDALALTLRMAFGLKRVRTERTLSAAQEVIRAGALPDAIILDLNLPDARGSEGIVTLRRLVPEVPVTLISADNDPGMISAVMAAGAQGYVSKSMCREEMCSALRRMWSGERVTPDDYDPETPSASATASEIDLAELGRRFRTLTPQQMKILRLICEGKANKEISYELSIAEATVKTHVTAIMAKIKARRRTQAVRMANMMRLFNGD